MGDRSIRRAAVSVCVALALGILSAGAVAAQTTVTDAQLRALATRAVGDPRALAQLRAVREVDGRPVDVGAALNGAEGPALAARLQALAAGGPTPVVAPDATRREAAVVLEGRRFKPSRVPRPLHGILATMGRWLKPVADPFRRFWTSVAKSVGAQLVLVAVVFCVAAAISLRLVGRRSPRALVRSRPFGVDVEGLDPDALEREAVVAEDGGDLDRAVRLRFVVGVLRLDRAGAIAYRSSMTTGQLKAGVHSASFEELAVAFDEIAYGGRPAEAADVQSARTTWPRVLAETRP